jgi:hypothetical protein
MSVSQYVSPPKCLDDFNEIWYRSAVPLLCTERMWLLRFCEETVRSTKAGTWYKIGTLRYRAYVVVIIIIISYVKELSPSTYISFYLTCFVIILVPLYPKVSSSVHLLMCACVYFLMGWVYTRSCILFFDLVFGLFFSLIHSHEEFIFSWLYVRLLFTIRFLNHIAIPRRL